MAKLGKTGVVIDAIATLTDEQIAIRVMSAHEDMLEQESQSEYAAAKRRLELWKAIAVFREVDLDINGVIK